MKEFAKTKAIAARLDALVEKMRSQKPVLGQWRYPAYDDTLWQFLKLNAEYDRLWAKIEKKLQ